MSDSGSAPKDTSITIPHVPMEAYNRWTTYQKESDYDRAQLLEITFNMYQDYEAEVKEKNDTIERISGVNSDLVAEVKQLKKLYNAKSFELDLIKQDKIDSGQGQ